MLLRPLPLLFGFIALLLMFCPFNSQAQQTVRQHIELKWLDTPRTIERNQQRIQMPTFEGATFDVDGLHHFPIFFKKIALKNIGKWEASLHNEQYVPMQAKNIPQIKGKIATEIEVTTDTAYERKQPSAVISFVPIRKNALTGQYEKLVSFDLLITTKNSEPSFSKKKNRSYTNNSVLNQGDFYKFRIAETGIYKIDLSFLQALSVNTSNIRLSNVRIYGNGNSILPELAGTERYDDLVENPLQAVDQNGNDVFDAGDYVLFYAKSPHQWTYVNKHFEHEQHPYSNYNYYFLNVDIGAGKRIERIASAMNPSVTVRTFNDYAYHETELRNFAKSGRGWFGEEFSAETSQDFTFNFPNLDETQSVELQTRLLANSSSITSSFTVRANGNQLDKYTVPRVPNELYPNAAESITRKINFPVNNDNLTINVTYNREDPTAKGWLDYIAINAHRQLSFSNTNGQFAFRHAASVANDQVTEFEVSGVNEQLQIWEVSNINAVQQMTLAGNGTTKSFVILTDTLKEFIAFDGSNLYAPEAIGKVERQNLHAEEFPDYIIITTPELIEPATQLADFHRENNQLNVKVVLIEQVYNEFSSGTPDITAIRDYVKMYYDRAGTDESKMLDYLLLFGDASYDYKNNKFDDNSNTNLIPTYESAASLDQLDTYCTDDYFGFLDDNEGSNLLSLSIGLDIGIGRIPARNAAEAQGVVDKIIHYHQPQTLGDWRNNITFFADDEDGNLHFNHAQTHIDKTLENSIYNIDKVYFDAYQQIITPGGGRYPAVNQAINDKIFDGSFIINYVGHGGENGWAQERVLSTTDIQKWSNLDKLPLFITATCSFSRYDDPEKVSAGEELILSAKGGAIAIMTTMRLVFADSNKLLNEKFLKRLFAPIDSVTGQMPALGYIARKAKNDAINAGRNNRKFTLLGDPALVLNYPKYRVQATSINGQVVDTSVITADTLSALSKVVIAGQIVDANEQLLENFNGTIYPTIFDKKVTLKTLGQDAATPGPGGNSGSRVAEFDVRRNIIFKGKASVRNGAFQFSFIVPKDIAYQFGSGRISFYAENGVSDAHGISEQLVIGGVSDEAANDDTPPDIELFLNNDKFVFGGLTNADPILIVKLKDDSGINTVGNGIGHDITATVDEDNANQLVLNNYYKAALDSYTEGEVSYQLNDLEPGIHSIAVKAWDVNNNSGKGYTEFVVAESAEMALTNVMNYPNPFTEQTAFWFEHNRPGDNLVVTIQIFTVGGKVIKTIQQNIVSDGFRVDDIIWDGLDDFGNKIGKGVYVYKLNVHSTNDLSRAHKIQKLVILK